MSEKYSVKIDVAKLDKIKEVMSENIQYAEHGLFFTKNIAGDTMNTLYRDDKCQVDICYHYGYFEMFGLNVEEQHCIRLWYFYLCNPDLKN